MGEGLRWDKAAIPSHKNPPGILIFHSNGSPSYTMQIQGHEAVLGSE